MRLTKFVLKQPILSGCTLLLFFALSMPLCGQAPRALFDSASSTPLPDAPGAVRFASSSSVQDAPEQDVPEGQGTQEPQATAAVSPQVAKRFATTIRPGETAGKLSAADKFQMSVRRQATLGSFSAAALSAGWAHLNDNRPHYGTDSAGFGERLGASNLKSATQSIFNFGLYANLFHQDPRYYVMGPEQPVKKRAIYAASRVFITRKDNGGNAPNWSLFAAVASSSALTNAYYPSRDRAIDRTFLNVLSTLATRMATQQFREFGGDIRQHLHLKKH